MKLLDGTELADYIKERQAKQVRNLRQSWQVAPKLVIIQTVDDPVIDMYVRMKRRDGDDIGVEVEVLRPTAEQVIDTIGTLNADSSAHGIIVQLPLVEGVAIENVLNGPKPVIR